jgi:hypothetical protein
MWKDPIVQELHDLRAQISHDLGGDMHRYAQLMRESQTKRIEQRATQTQTPYKAATDVQQRGAGVHV